MKIKTAKLEGVELDWAVAQAEGVQPFQWKWYRRAVATEDVGENVVQYYGYSQFWRAGGPIIERERIHISPSVEGGWSAYFAVDFDMLGIQVGATPLIAAMRCYVASKLGAEVDVPTA